MLYSRPYILFILSNNLNNVQQSFLQSSNQCANLYNIATTNYFDYAFHDNHVQFCTKINIFSESLLLNIICVLYNHLAPHHSPQYFASHSPENFNQFIIIILGVVNVHNSGFQIGKDRVVFVRLSSSSATDISWYEAQCGLFFELLFTI